MSINNNPQQRAEGEAYPPWFSAYQKTLSLKQEEVKVKALETVLQDCDDISTQFKSNISAAYRTEAQLEAAWQTDRKALDEQLLRTPVSYNVP